MQYITKSVNFTQKYVICSRSYKTFSLRFRFSLFSLSVLLHIEEGKNYMISCEISFRTAKIFLGFVFL